MAIFQFWPLWPPLIWPYNDRQYGQYGYCFKGQKKMDEVSIFVLEVQDEYEGEDWNDLSDRPPTDLLELSRLAEMGKTFPLLPRRSSAPFLSKRTLNSLINFYNKFYPVYISEFNLVGLLSLPSGVDYPNIQIQPLTQPYNLSWGQL